MDFGGRVIKKGLFYSEFNVLDCSLNLIIVLSHVSVLAAAAVNNRFDIFNMNVWLNRDMNMVYSCHLDAESLVVLLFPRESEM